MRLFIAIPVNETVREYAGSLRNQMAQDRPDVKWVEPQNYHLTLKFLGEVSENNMEAIQNKLCMAAQACTPFILEVNGVGFFPNRNRPRVIWSGVRGEMEKAAFLGERIDTYLSELGFDPEKKRSFHLTLGRVRSDVGLDMVRLKADEASRSNKVLALPVEKFMLMASQLSSRGPQYSIVESYILEN